MKRILLTIAYDGTGYSGWQRQDNALSVQEAVEDALSRLLRETITVAGLSRTDAGVHARCNMATMDTTRPIPADKLPYAALAYLPPDVVIREAREVAPDFSLRHCDCLKTYRYTVYRDALPDPLETRFAYFTFRTLDVEAMRRAAAQLVGEHDFQSFCSAGAQVQTTVRRLVSVEISEDGKKLYLDVTGTGFLYNMVRILTGTLLEVGQGRRAPDSVTALLAARDRTQAGPTLPPQGLCLAKVQLFPEGFPPELKGKWAALQQ